MRKLFLFNSQISIFYYKFFNKFFLKNLKFIKFIFLPSFYFFKNLQNGIIFFFFNKFFFKSFISHIKMCYNEFFFLFSFFYKLRGLGYRLKKLTTKLIRIFMGTTNYIYIHVPSAIYVKVRRRLILSFSFSKHYLKTLSIFLECLKKIIPYKLRGFFFPRQIILMKPGKKRF